MHLLYSILALVCFLHVALSQQKYTNDLGYRRSEKKYGYRTKPSYKRPFGRRKRYKARTKKTRTTRTTPSPKTLGSPSTEQDKDKVGARRVQVVLISINSFDVFCCTVLLN